MGAGEEGEGMSSAGWWLHSRHRDVKHSMGSIEDHTVIALGGPGGR